MTHTTGSILVGIDEAGVGPLLGPMTIGYAVLRVPKPDDDPWKLLNRVVTRNPKRDKRRLVVADSKKVFTRNGRGRRRLEATVLATLAQLRQDLRPPQDPRELLFGPLRPRRELIDDHPWYEHLPKHLPRFVEARRVELDASLLERHMSRTGCKLLDAGVRIVPAGELNDSYDLTENKSLSVWSKSLEVLRHTWRTYGANSPWVVLDRQGSRSRYGSLLARGLRSASVRLVREDVGLSEYELEERGGGERRMRLVIVERAEEIAFAVALASCLAKYARELVMEGFNAYFAGLQPGLRPTAGYRTDANRWLSDAKPALRRAQLPQRVLVRAR
ncbi:MAG: hypothetical protein O7B99_05945 [Planctomycetota bacterium]|nr:hypothetical protein [Planctomycetota bacterium]